MILCIPCSCPSWSLCPELKSLHQSLPGVSWLCCPVVPKAYQRSWPVGKYFNNILALHYCLLPSQKRSRLKISMKAQVQSSITCTGYSNHISHKNSLSNFTVVATAPSSQTEFLDYCKIVHAETSLVGHWAHDLTNSRTAKLAEEGGASIRVTGLIGHVSHACGNCVYTSRPSTEEEKMTWFTFSTPDKIALK